MSFSGFLYLVKEGIKNVWNNRMMSLASVCVLISCLLLTGSAIMLTMNVGEIVDSIGAENVTTVYLDEGLSDLQAVYVGKDILKVDNVEAAEFYSKDEAIESYRDVMSEEVFENMTGENNPLPDAYLVTMGELENYDTTIEKIKEIEGVDTVSSRSEVADKLANLSSLITTLSFWIILALALISLFIISNTIKMTMYSRRFEISIMKSVGATNAFVRVPFIFEGMIMGLFSGVLSTALLVFLYDAVVKAINNIVPFTAIPFTDVIWQIGIAFVVAGMLVGALGSLISISKYLKKEGNEILGW